MTIYLLKVLVGKGRTSPMFGGGWLTARGIIDHRSDNSKSCVNKDLQHIPETTTPTNHLNDNYFDLETADIDYETLHTRNTHAFTVRPRLTPQSTPLETPGTTPAILLRLRQQVCEQHSSAAVDL